MCAVVSVSLLWVPETNQYELPQTIEECEDWYRQNQLQLRCCHRKDSNVCVEKGTSEEDAQDKK
ncbi:hypothetical protein DPMN_112537 [Dreissena polymorpha]|uniref:Uncharacterized protein n=2 Tax=Dreissena polymorpha TaxID=45954 RepID=A0A9D4QPZ3_DREPO|nr:hypothetical protein DPMN_112537 [Dreissena polymorpha]